MGAYGIGYVHAQDRLWQLEKTRRFAKGTLSEIFGEKALNVDKMARTIGFARIASETLKNLSEKDKIFMQSYTDGVNDFIGGMHLFGKERTSKALPPEFLVLGIDTF
mmetsp:Transcript_48572/g.35749  ORF Transcript_48572/g.35749 Transcript_48572/m.35749 type:complete len:107 (-) Transcript_48572:85-405(-)